MDLKQEEDWLFLDKVEDRRRYYFPRHSVIFDSIIVPFLFYFSHHCSQLFLYLMNKIFFTTQVIAIIFFLFKTKSEFSKLI